MTNGQASQVAQAYASFRLEIDPSADVKAAEANMRTAMDKLDKMLAAERARIRDDTTKAGRQETKARLAEIEKQKRDVEKAKKDVLAEQQFQMREAEKAQKAEQKLANQKRNEQARAASDAVKQLKQMKREEEKERQRAMKDAEKAQKDEQKKKDAAAKELANKKKSQLGANSEGSDILGAGKVSVLASAMRTLGAMSAGAFAAAAIAALAVGAVAIGVKSIKSSAEKESLVFRRNRLNRQGGNGTGWSNEQLDQMSRSIASIGTQSEKTITSAQSLLLTFRNIKGDQFANVLKLSSDISAVMGIDMVQAAGKLGEALDNPISAAEGGLEGLGVQFSILEQAQIKSAVAARDYAGAQDLIIAKLNAFKGASEEFAQTTEGRWQAVKVKFDQLTEKIGAALLPALNSVLDFMLNFMSHAEFVWNNFGDAADIAAQAVWVGFLELGDHCKDVFLLILGHWWGVMKAMKAAAGWGWDAIKGIFNGEDAGSFGQKVADAYFEGVQDFIKHSGKSNVVAAEEKKLNDMLNKYRAKKAAVEQKDNKMPEKPAGEQSPYVNTKPTSWFENSGIAELSKKIQNQLIPNSVESKLDIQNKLAQDGNVKADAANSLLGAIAMTIATVAKSKAGPAVFGK